MYIFIYEKRNKKKKKKKKNHICIYYIYVKILNIYFMYNIL